MPGESVVNDGDDGDDEEFRGGRGASNLCEISSRPGDFGRERRVAAVLFEIVSRNPSFERI